MKKKMLIAFKKVQKQGGYSAALDSVCMKKGKDGKSEDWAILSSEPCGSHISGL